MLKLELSECVPKLIRSEQCGDWTYDSDSVTAWSAELDHASSELAIAIHELIEGFLCRRDKVADDSVVEFDEQYERERKEGKHPDDAEPGDDERSPYRLQHQAATHVERAVCAALGITWQGHDEVVLRSAENLK